MQTHRSPSPLALPAMMTALVFLVPAGAHSTDWPQYRGPNHNGVSSEKMLQTWPTGGLKTIWRTPLNNGFSAFAVAGGKAFTLVNRDIENVPNEVCVALGADTGQELWAAPLGFAKYDNGGDTGAPGNTGGDGPRSTPAADSNRVYVLTANLGLFCLDARNGRTVWKKELTREHGARNIRWQNAASPVLEGNLIFVCGGGGAGQSLLCFHKATGAVVWKSQSDALTHATPTVATILGHRQVIFLTQSGLVSVVPGTGQVLWRHPFPYRTSTAAAPVVGGDIVCCSAGYGVGAGAVRISRNGTAWKATQLWRKENDLINHWSTPVYHDGHLFGLFGFKQWQQVPLKCVDLATGQEKWSRDGFGQGGTILVDGRVVALTERGDLVVIEARPGAYQEAGRHRAVNGKCWNNAAVANGRIYARSTKEGVCLDVAPHAAPQ